VSAASCRSESASGLALVGVLIIGADAAYAAATTVGYLSVVAVLAALHPVITIALGDGRLNADLSLCQ
jgi:hypothetical protein